MSTQIQNFYESFLTRNWTATTGDFNVSVAPSISEGIIVISPSSRTLREIVRFTATGTNAYGPFVTVSNIAHRGLGGTTAQVHTIGEKVRMNITAEHWLEMQTDINNIVAAGAPMASTTTAGLVEEATDAEILAKTDTGDTGARLFVVPSKMTLQSAIVEISSAEILALYTTPKELLPAPGVGKINIIDEVVFSYTHNSTAYVSNGNSYLHLYYNGLTNRLVNYPNISIITTASSSIKTYYPDAEGNGEFVENTGGENKSVILVPNAANPTTGDGTLKVFIKYRILTL